MSGFIEDLRFAIRLLRKAPGSASIAVLTLALGIGANTGIFSLIRGVLLKPLGYPEPDRLIFAAGRTMSANRTEGPPEGGPYRCVSG